MKLSDPTLSTCTLTQAWQRQTKDTHSSSITVRSETVHTLCVAAEIRDGFNVTRSNKLEKNETTKRYFNHMRAAIERNLSGTCTVYTVWAHNSWLSHKHYSTDKMPDWVHQIVAGEPQAMWVNWDKDQRLSVQLSSPVTPSYVRLVTNCGCHESLKFSLLACSLYDGPRLRQKLLVITELRFGSASVLMLVDATAWGAFRHDAAPVNPPKSGPDLQIPQWPTAGEDVIFSRLLLSLRRGGGQLLHSQCHIAPWAPHRDW